MFSTKKLFLVLALFMNVALQAASDPSQRQDLFFAECVNYLEDVVKDPNKKLSNYDLGRKFFTLFDTKFFFYTTRDCNFLIACNLFSRRIPSSFDASKYDDEWQRFLDWKEAVYEEPSMYSYAKFLSASEYVEQNPKDRTIAFVEYFSERATTDLIKKELEQPHVQEFLKKRTEPAVIHDAAASIVIVAAKIDRRDKERQKSEQLENEKRLTRERRQKNLAYSAAAGLALLGCGGIYYFKPLKAWFKKQFSRLQLFPRRS